MNDPTVALIHALRECINQLETNRAYGSEHHLHWSNERVNMTSAAILAGRKAIDAAAPAAAGRPFPERDPTITQAVMAAIRETIKTPAKWELSDGTLSAVFLATGIPLRIAAGHRVTPADWMEFGRAAARVYSARAFEAIASEPSVQNTRAHTASPAKWASPRSRKSRSMTTTATRRAARTRAATNGT